MSRIAWSNSGFTSPSVKDEADPDLQALRIAASNVEFAASRFRETINLHGATPPAPVAHHAGAILEGKQTSSTITPGKSQPRTQHSKSEKGAIDSLVNENGLEQQPSQVGLVDNKPPQSVEEPSIESIKIENVEHSGDTRRYIPPSFSYANNGVRTVRSSQEPGIPITSEGKRQGTPQSARNKPKSQVDQVGQGNAALLPSTGNHIEPVRSSQESSISLTPNGKRKGRPPGSKNKIKPQTSQANAGENTIVLKGTQHGQNVTGNTGLIMGKAVKSISRPRSEDNFKKLEAAGTAQDDSRSDRQLFQGQQAVRSVPRSKSSLLASTPTGNFRQQQSRGLQPSDRNAAVVEFDLHIFIPGKFRNDEALINFFQTLIYPTLLVELSKYDNVDLPSEVFLSVCNEVSSFMTSKYTMRLNSNLQVVRLYTPFSMKDLGAFLRSAITHQNHTNKGI